MIKSTNFNAAALPVLELGASLDVGAWNLEL
jgi:hypothetical protein